MINDRTLPVVRTVLGDLDPGQLGRTDYHDHLFQVSPLLPGDELDDEQASGVEAGSLHAAGFSTLVEPTPIGLGRRPEALARISRITGLRVVATTGAHREAHYGAGHWLLDCNEDELAEAFCRDVLDWMPVADTCRVGSGVACTPGGAPVRAGVVKIGIDYWRITDFEHRVLAAAGSCHRRTGAAVMVHLEFGSAAFEVLDALRLVGVPGSAVVLAHADRNPDPGLHTELVAAGAYLGYDGWARHRQWPDSVLLDCLIKVAEAGGRDRLMIGGDVARRTRYRGYGGMPGLAYLGERVVPRLSALGSPDLTDAVLVRNPARWLSGGVDTEVRTEGVIGIDHDQQRCATAGSPGGDDDPAGHRQAGGQQRAVRKEVG